MVAGRPSHTSLRWEDVLAAYAIGMFPMADPDDGSISWYAPDPRAVLELDRCHPTRSLRRTMRSNLFDIRWNSAFVKVMEACAERDETWISRQIIEAYTALHERGAAHSVECWKDGVLAGGLYGVALGGAFFGESMFTRETDASKVALMHLAERMRERTFVLLDAQFLTPHLKQFGGVNIPRQTYVKRLRHALTLTCSLYP